MKLHNILNIVTHRNKIKFVLEIEKSLLKDSVCLFNYRFYMKLTYVKGCAKKIRTITKNFPMAVVKPMITYGLMVWLLRTLQARGIR